MSLTGSETGERLPGLYKGLLKRILSFVGAPEHSERDTESRPFVGTHDGFVESLAACLAQSNQLSLDLRSQRLPRFCLKWYDGPTELLQSMSEWSPQLSPGCSPEEPGNPFDQGVDLLLRVVVVRRDSNRGLDAFVIEVEDCVVPDG